MADPAIMGICNLKEEEEEETECEPTFVLNQEAEVRVDLANFSAEDETVSITLGASGGNSWDNSFMPGAPVVRPADGQQYAVAQKAIPRGTATNDGTVVVEVVGDFTGDRVVAPIHPIKFING